MAQESVPTRNGVSGTKGLSTFSEGMTITGLRRPIFRKSAVYGHFGRDDTDFTRENIDAAMNCER